jgi:hypothetical protein
MLTTLEGGSRSFGFARVARVRRTQGFSARAPIVVLEGGLTLGSQLWTLDSHLERNTSLPRNEIFLQT